MWQARAEFLGSQLEQAQLALQSPRIDSPEMAHTRDSERVPVEPTQTPIQAATAGSMVDALASSDVLTGEETTPPTRW